MSPKAFRFNGVLKTDRKTAQFKPVELSFGIEEGRESESDVIVKDLVSTRFHKCEQMLIRGSKRWWRAP